MTRIHAPLALALLLLPACVQKHSLGALDDETTGDATTDSTTTDSPTGDAPPIDSPADCPQGQAPGTLLWETDIAAWMSAMDLTFSLTVTPMRRLADGRVVLALQTAHLAETAAGMLVVSPAGEILGRDGEPPGTASWAPAALAVAADDQRYILGERAEAEQPITQLAHYAADGALIAKHDLDLQFLHNDPYVAPTLALADKPVVAGFDVPTQTSRLAKIDPDTGATLWSELLGDADTLLVRNIAVGPAGELVVAVQTEAAVSNEIWLSRFTPDGAPVWRHDLGGPDFTEVTDLQFAPDGDLLLLRAGPEGGTAEVQLLGIEADDGSVAWQQTVAAASEARGNPWSQGLLLAADRVTVPITWSRANSHLESSMTRALEVHTLSLQGEALALTTLADPLPGHGWSSTQVVRGRCGELVVLVQDEYPILLRAYAQ